MIKTRILLLFSVLLTGCAASGSKSDAQQQLAAVANQPIPMLGGGQSTFAQLSAGKVTVLNFWATWCAPCIREMPDLIAVRQQYQAKGVQVLALTIENPSEAMKTVKASAQTLRLPFKVGFASKEFFAPFNSLSGGGTNYPIPQTFVLDGQGRVVASTVGACPDYRGWLSTALQQALQGGAR